jgi:multimeric flavodoxin WrbA
LKLTRFRSSSPPPACERHRMKPNGCRRKGSPMIRILGIAGSPVREGNTETFLKEALSVMAADPEVQTEILNLSGLQIAGCQHCNWCIKNQRPEKFCAISDGMDEVYPALARADVIILATPVHIGRMSGLMANMIDRMRVFVYGNVHRGKLKDKVGGALIVGFLRHGGLEVTLSNLNTTFALFNMISVGRGGLALTSLDGKGKTTRGVRHMVMQDAFGLFSAREVVQRAVEIARIIQAGKKALRISA